MKLESTPLCREKFATRMLYWALCWRIQSHAAITSDVRPSPVVVDDVERQERCLGIGARPVASLLPAAIEATIVPWPRPSPAEFGPSDVRLT